MLCCCLCHDVVKVTVASDSVSVCTFLQDQLLLITAALHAWSPAAPAVASTKTTSTYHYHCHYYDDDYYYHHHDDDYYYYYHHLLPLPLPLLLLLLLLLLRLRRRRLLRLLPTAPNLPKITLNNPSTEQLNTIPRKLIPQQSSSKHSMAKHTHVI